MQNGIAIHNTAVVEQNVVLKGPVIIGPGCFVAANGYLREGVHLIADVKIGPGVEIKTSVIFPGSALAHFNYAGNSIIGSHVNFEAGAVIANHYNERADKVIAVTHNGQSISTGTEKFGALVGDRAKIGANAVLSPGTLLEPGAIVKRLQLIG
jgi:NDP-sugar pyrophosphorylase family protein